MQSLCAILSDTGHTREADSLTEVLALCLLETDFGGLGLNLEMALTEKDETEILFLVGAWMESLNSADRSKLSWPQLSSRPEGRRGMTLSEKIFASHDIARRGFVKPGDLIRVDVDWVMASEASWAGMERTYQNLGSPGIFRNDRFWLAGDHVVDPRVNEMPQVKHLINASERAKHVFKMTDYQGMNYTIMHTEFFRERAQPGMLIIGSDSHTCSSGALGCLAIGLGAADVTMPLVTGETWFKVPESVNIRLINSPPNGIGGKDTILYILKELKRNTVAAEKVVEFTGPGVQSLSCDARFAIANMTTEFGGITGIFVPDQVTSDFVNRRKSPRHKKDLKYYHPDEDAVYSGTYEIDLAKVEPFVALYPCPDDVVPVSKIAGTQLDGCFIGACTTTEEDLILGALILEQGLKNGMKPTKSGKRKVVPGSMPILNKLRETGMLEIYEAAGFEIGIPGCSYCVGMSADRAGPGEVWLSSQNRNFENRMGKGSFGNLASAITVAASSFEMKVFDPRPLLKSIELDRLDKIIGHAKKPPRVGESMTYIEPGGPCVSLTGKHEIKQQTSQNAEGRASLANSERNKVRRGKIQRLGDFIDTDALAPAEFLVSSRTSEAIGSHCLEFTHPEFRARAKEGYNIVVAGDAFGCGSSREQAVSALMGCGVICVIAKSFAFIYARNQANLGLLGVTIKDDSFYAVALDGTEITIDLGSRVIFVGRNEYPFTLSQMEEELISSGGITAAFQRFGKSLFDVMCSAKPSPEHTANLDLDGEEARAPQSSLQW
ncbi:uncharacterized protein N7515_008141 [Penicillium bovifimosum]|uniref:Aconitase family protein n=1 Tax=Penicillium bovifimosum TaxID=126998 RepID=A0A9W9KXF8_9EURO|nr:uncharacterized protein N7515_008141 [Penicillium bovifimosum]KAJ5124316.1 hypothetical protein N7515_008141 [Penicillium bovifimosum]